MLGTNEGCYVCGYPVTEIHHIFGGANRKISDKYGFTVRLCHYHHNEPPDGAHFNRDFDLAHFDFKNAKEIIHAHKEYRKSISDLNDKRSLISNKKIHAEMYEKSIVWAYFVQRKKTI